MERRLECGAWSVLCEVCGDDPWPPVRGERRTRQQHHTFGGEEKLAVGAAVLLGVLDVDVLEALACSGRDEGQSGHRMGDEGGEGRKEATNEGRKQGIPHSTAQHSTQPHRVAVEQREQWWWCREHVHSLSRTRNTFLPMVPVDSSAARMPLPLPAMARAFVINSAAVWWRVNLGVGPRGGWRGNDLTHAHVTKLG